jgi:hypothetical protein
MSDIIMDSSSKVFTIDKEILQFNINPNISSMDNDNSSKSSIHPVSSCSIVVTNLTDNYIAFRSKTTKKDLYVVNPPYTIIKPNNNQQILIEFFMKHKSLHNREGHKFKFEGIVIEDSDINKPPKKIFEEKIANKIQVKGNTCKRNVEFIEDDNYDYHQKPQNIPNNSVSESINLSRNSLYQSVNDTYHDFDELKNLKIEYNKLKNKISELNTEYNILKNKIEQQKNINVNNNINNSSNSVINSKFNYVPPDSKEIKLPEPIAAIVCFIALMIGFFLTK